MASSLDTTFERKPYHGSCHCGLIKYIAYLSLPTPSSPIPSTELMVGKSGLRIYRCNCTTCQKMGILHLRLRDAPGDFLLLSPLDEKKGGVGEGMKEYKCNAGESSWYFCGSCGVRCFTVCAEGTEVVEVEVPGSKEKGKVWRIVKDGFKEGKGEKGYFSLNAATLEAGQEGLDLREWHENGWVSYCDSLDDEGEWRFGRPHRGGMY